VETTKALQIRLELFQSAPARHIVLIHGSCTVYRTGGRAKVDLSMMSPTSVCRRGHMGQPAGRATTSAARPARVFRFIPASGSRVTPGGAAGTPPVEKRHVPRPRSGRPGHPRRRIALRNSLRDDEQLPGRSRLLGSPRLAGTAGRGSPAGAAADLRKSGWGFTDSRCL